MHVKKKLTYGGDSSNNFSQFKFVQDCCFTSCIKTHCRTEEEEKKCKTDLNKVKFRRKRGQVLLLKIGTGQKAGSEQR